MQRDELANLSPTLMENIIGLYGEKGDEWLHHLPEIVAGIEANWLIKIKKPFADLSYHFVAPCVCADGSEAVVKLGFRAENSTIPNEAKILKIFDGEGAVKLLRFDEKQNALLLERLKPGETLKKIAENDDARATSIAVGIMRRIWRKPSDDNSFPVLEKWIDGLKKPEAAAFAPYLVNKARDYYDELLALSNQQMLLHGDLHHANILSAEREPFLAIDPKGIVGDIGYEISVFLNNPRSRILSLPNRKQVLMNRIWQFAEAFEIEPQDLMKWAFAEAVLSAWWTVEDNGNGWQKWLACAEMWEDFGA